MSGGRVSPELRLVVPDPNEYKRDIGRVSLDSFGYVTAPDRSDGMSGTRAGGHFCAALLLT